MSTQDKPSGYADHALRRAEKNRRYRQWRWIKDRLARYGIGMGGVSAIVAIVLIFFYLLWVALPLFRPAELSEQVDYPTPATARALHLAMEEQAEIGSRFDDSGTVTFFATNTGRTVDTVSSLLPEGGQVASFAAGDPTTAVVAYGLTDGRAVVLKHSYQVTFPDDARLITPGIEHPLGNEPVVVDPEGHALSQLAIQVASDKATLAAVTDDGRLLLVTLEVEQSLLGGGTWATSRTVIAEAATAFTHLIIDLDQHELYAADAAGQLHYYDITDPAETRLVQTVRPVPNGVSITALRFLTGGISVLIGRSDGNLEQWFPVRDADNNYSLAHVRDFDPLPGAVTDIAPEFGRKGFLAVDDRGTLGVYHTTAHRTIIRKQVADTALRELAVGPRANAFIAEKADGRLRFGHIHNEHPEISWSSLWGKVWYESYAEPQFVWQSSAATNDFEPKFSLTPITFGTLKAAFYAMIFAIPLAIFGAIYTAYFMAPKMRQLVKPVIEIMEALPTVILGFLAGLWLAPFLETHLPGVLSMLIIMPVGVVAFAGVWQRLPEKLRQLVPEGWEGALLIPVLIVIAWMAIAASQPMELALFGGDVRKWLSHDMGIDFDQRNSLVVGFAMGFAVIPTIFSIAEDAIFGVPRHLTQGSLALGATPWQTLAKVVILTASPGIFSAVMIGLGRAVGETMIVLMATGNTPVMDFSIFQGMRTLSANIAVEMPEAEVNSTHYRVLFLAAIVLFVATFLFNTLAEIVRQRLRRKYSSL